MLNIQKMIASARECLGWPYVSPGTNDSRGIDCSGLFVKIFRDQGASIYHGSNTIYRKYCREKGKLTKTAQLQPGMAVFKWNPNTPEKFNDGLGDFQHIGLVVSVKPLEIIHASTGTMCVTTDTKLGTWKYWGKLKDVDYTSTGGEDAVENTDEPATEGKKGQDEEKTVWIEASNGGRVNIRAGNGLNYGRLTSVHSGTALPLVAIASNGWYAVKLQNAVGWVSPDFASLGVG